MKSCAKCLRLKTSIARRATDMLNLLKLVSAAGRAGETRAGLFPFNKFKRGA